MSSDFRSAMIQVIAQLCGQVGFEQITEASLELLINVVEAYFLALVKNVHTLASSDGCAQVADGLLALRLMGQTPQGLAKFVVENNQFFTQAPSMTCGPVYGKLCLNIPPANHPELEERPLFIPRHLPLNYREDFESQLFSQAEPTIKQFDSNTFLSPSPLCTTSTSAHCPTGANSSCAVTTVARTLPEWATRSTYRMTCVSVDPLTNCLVEHCPPWKTSDVMSESPIPDNYAGCSTNSYFSSISKRELAYDSTPEDVKNSYESPSSPPKQHGASDAQWAAALQATPLTQQPKRIVYTPSRFDPSSTQSWTHMRRTSNSSRISLFSKHSIGTDSLYKRQASSLAHSSAPKIPRLTAGCRANRRSKFSRGRTNKLSRQRISKSSRSNSPTIERHSDNTSVVDNSLNPTSEFSNSKEDIINTELSPLDSDISTISNPRSSPKSVNESSLALTQKIINDDSASHRTDFGDEKHTVWNGEDYVDHDSPCTPPLRNPVNNDFLSTVVSSSNVVSSPSQLGSSMRPLVNELFDSKVLNIPEKSISTEAEKCVRLKPHQFRRRVRGRRRDKCRISTFNSLFQNPLRKKCSDPPQTKSQDNVQNLEHTPMVENNIDDHSTIKVTPDGRFKGSRPTRFVNKAGRCAGLKTDSPHDSMKSGAFAMPSSPFDAKIEAISSPSSDTTEPMTFGDRAELFRILPVDTSFVKYTSSSNLNVISSNHFLKSENSIFSKESFGKLQEHASVALRSLPSSPSSLDSSLCSSSTSKSPEESLFLKSEMNDMKGDNFENDTSQNVNKFLIPSSCIQNTINTNLSTVNFSDSIKPQITSCSNKVHTTHPVPHSPIDTLSVGPPPLLPLSSKSTDQKSCSSLFLPTSTESEHASALLPSLMPSNQSESVSTSNSCFFTNSQALSSKQVNDRNGGLRITIKLGGGALNEEHLASSLSPSSSSSSLSSSESTSGDEDNTVHYNQPLSTTQVSRKESNENSVTNLIDKDRSDKHSGSLLQSITEKTPKLVIRLGNGPILSSQSQTVATSHVQSYDHNLTNHLENSTSLVDKKQSGSLTTPPPPLQLTISRDRLKYRGRPASQGSNSNASNTSSTITGSLSSSEDEEESTILSQVNSMGNSALPPPPSLERLPPRVGHPTTKGQNLHHSQLFPPSLTSSVKVSDSLLPLKHKASISTAIQNGPNLVTTHCHLPPLLPLFSISEQKVSVSPSSNSSPVLMEQSSQSIKLKSNLVLDNKKKREFPDQDSDLPLTKRRTSKPYLVHSSKTEMIVKRPRATVDSVFTDDDSDTKNEEKPLLSLTASCSNDAVDNQKSFRPSNSRNVYIPHSPSNSVVPFPNSIPSTKIQPRTKHTSLYKRKSLYHPVTKSPRSISNKGSTSLKSGKVRGRSKLIPTSPIKTPSITNISSKIVQRETASQIVVESAGSSYYFNNDGEQIWLCPICLLEDDGNLMIGCDNCQDWYHSTCLGLSKAPEVPQWFCPKCSQKPLPSTNSLLSKGSSHGSLNSSRPNVKHSAREPGSKNPKYKPKR
ncbi:Transcription initiation factor TFIID subunit 3 [Schistosoma japonicum]|uniref:Transcription initiation factor TFIID subunit 3 n=2 Tax=Schistosoma japonicum TaxID=6182 RepID=A0A4Z2CX31_SCHJA|nr:Transcription initiation factor TFIID subunit 3 [Schistosoma japonicum]